MNHINTVFYQLLRFIPKHRFDEAVKRHQGDYRVRHLNCWGQFIAMLYAQLSGCQSLRHLESTFNSHSNHHYHLGVRGIRRSTLADANKKRPLGLYKELFFSLLGQVQTKTAKEAQQVIRLIDSTTIDLNKQHFSWAHFRSHKAGIKLHFIYDPEQEVPTFFSMIQAKVNDRKAANTLPIITNATYVFDRAYNDYGWYYEQMHLKGNRFVGRMKVNAQYVVIAAQPVQDNIREDQTIRLSSEKGKKCPIPLRRVRFIRREDEKEIVLISNDLTSPAEEIMALYKQRWQIELFFKWIKQNLKIKRFFGTTEHAVHLQVLIAMIAYLLLKLVNNSLSTLQVSLQQLTRLISANLFQRKSVIDLIALTQQKRKPLKPRQFVQSELQFS
jgi:IS4 transposase